jgi:hypothetical protein
MDGMVLMFAAGILLSSGTTFVAFAAFDAWADEAGPWRITPAQYRLALLGLVLIGIAGRLMLSVGL